MATAEASPPTPTRSGIHVVVLDESPALAAAFASEFARAGYRVSVLTDCDQVDPTDLVRLRPDLIVLDVACGVGRGMGLLRDLRALPAGRTVPVIASPTITLYDRRGRARPSCAPSGRSCCPIPSRWTACSRRRARRWRGRRRCAGARMPASPGCTAP
jgi:CheY-like chemotaxis protein